MSSLQKSTTVRFRNVGLRLLFRYGEHLAPRRTARVARDLWFQAPPRMADAPLPDAGEPFEVDAQGHTVRGRVWEPRGPRRSRRRGKVPTMYLVHGWGGRGSQLGAFVEPLREEGYRVVAFDAPAHGDSDPGPAGRGRAHGMEFARALDAVFYRFGPAEAVVAHSMGGVSTYLAIRSGWFGTGRLALVAPMIELGSLFDQFQEALGFGRRTRSALDIEVERFVGLPVGEFDARVQAAAVEPLPTLVVTDRGDRQSPYDQVADFAEKVGARLVTTEGLGHRKILHDPDVVRTVVDFVTGRPVQAREESTA